MLRIVLKIHLHVAILTLLQTESVRLLDYNNLNYSISRRVSKKKSGSSISNLKCFQKGKKKLTNLDYIYDPSLLEMTTSQDWRLLARSVYQSFFAF